MTYNIKFGNSTALVNFEYFVSPHLAPNYGASYAGNLINDTSEAVVFVSRPDPTPPVNSNNWSPAVLHLFEWVNGKWADTTSNKFESNGNQVIGTTSVFFADINGDGKIDLISPTFTDTDTDGPLFYWINDGSKLIQHEIDINNQSHGAFITDLNHDGMSDLLVIGGYGSGVAYGSTSGMQWYPVESFSGASICAADFLNNGTISVVRTDVPKNYTYYNELWGYSFDDGQPALTFIADLPTPRFLLPKWNSYNFGPITPETGLYRSGSHNVRTLPMDFNHDGLMDVIILSRPHLTNNQWPFYSEIQFCQNMSGGQFIDVTDSILVGYNINSSVCYQPQIEDFNHDGLQDIFLSEGDFVGNVSNTILIQTSDGHFVETGRAAFSALYASCVAKTKGLVPNGYAPGIAFSGGNPMSIAKAGDGNYYVFTDVTYLANNATSTREEIFTTPLNVVLQIDTKPTGTLTISGKALFDNSLTAVVSNIKDEDGLGTFSYQWQVSTDKVNWTSIDGATQSKLNLSTSLVGAYVRPVINYTDQLNYDETINGESSSLVFSPKTWTGNSGYTLIGGYGTSIFVINEGEVAVTNLGVSQSKTLHVMKAATANATLGDSWKASAASYNLGTANISTNGHNIDLSTITKGKGFYVTDSSSISISIVGSRYTDTIAAGIGNDTISGGLCNDTLTGGEGNDTFAFNRKLGSTNIDTITDFSTGIDKIALDDAIFTKLRGDKDLSDNFYIQSIPGISTQDTNDYLFYDFESGQLYYDADGSGIKSVAVLIAIIGSATEIATTDFVIV